MVNYQDLESSFSTRNNIANMNKAKLDSFSPQFVTRLQLKIGWYFC